MKESWSPPTRYQNVRPLARGGMGELCVADDLQTGKQVVIKRPRLDTRMARVQLEQRFQREQKLLTSVSHPNIVEVVEVGQHDGQFYIVTRWLDGIDLRKTLENGGPLPLSETLRILGAVCRAVEHLHKVGILHRDLQPGNVLLGSDGSIKVTDFGIAVSLDDLGQMTQTGEILGTADYMSPEQRHRLPMDQRSDQFSIGTLAYQMLTAHRAAGLFPPPSELNPDVPKAVGSVVMRSLSRDPADRFATVDEFRAQLEFAVQQSVLRRRSHWTKGVAAALSLVLVGMAVSVVWRSEVVATPESETFNPAEGNQPNPLNAVESPMESQQVRELQAAWAEYLSQPILQQNSIGMQMALIPPGEFLMGASDDDVRANPDPARISRLHPRHLVKIPRPFLIGTYEVTVSQFRKFVDATDFKTDAEAGNGRRRLVPNRTTNLQPSWRSPGYVQSDQHPVVHVSWDDAVAFCSWFSEEEDASYRLPTEAEWEYCCRAGTHTAWSFGDDVSLLPKYSWSRPAVNDGDFCVPTTVGAPRQPNAFGLFDMHGNVAEWCAEVFDLQGDTEALAQDPIGVSAIHGAHCIRGSGSMGIPWVQRCAVRPWRPHNDSSFSWGFRVLAEIPVRNE